jgi:phenylpropionate dioxygenase-like ring-hydroxylating dioxygenase large terminal subunit
MSDIGRRAHLQRSAAQLPVSAYFDEALYQREIEILFRQGPGYIGHELMVPNTGDYFALPAEKEGRLLVRGEQGIELLSNVCRHRQAVMLNGRGNTTNIVCPLHRWTYDLSGQLLGAPHFEQQPCLNLGKSPLQNWNGLLFSGQRDVAADLERAGVRVEQPVMRHAGLVVPAQLANRVVGSIRV